MTVTASPSGPHTAGEAQDDSKQEHHTRKSDSSTQADVARRWCQGENAQKLASNNETACNQGGDATTLHYSA